MLYFLRVLRVLHVLSVFGWANQLCLVPTLVFAPLASSPTRPPPLPAAPRHCAPFLSFFSRYTDTQDRLEKVSAASAGINQAKGRTLDEISQIVTDINSALKERKNKLAPQIKELRVVRQEYQEVENGYLEKKSMFENTAVGLESERIKLEQSCGQNQDDCLQEESRYHYLNCLSSIADTHLEKVRLEEKYEKGEGRLLPNFKCFRELYMNKISSQENMAKEMRKQQKEMKESSPMDSKVRPRMIRLIKGL